MKFAESPTTHVCITNDSRLKLFSKTGPQIDSIKPRNITQVSKSPILIVKPGVADPDAFQLNAPVVSNTSQLTRSLNESINDGVGRFCFWRCNRGLAENISFLRNNS